VGQARGAQGPASDPSAPGAKRICGEWRERAARSISSPAFAREALDRPELADQTQPIGATSTANPPTQNRLGVWEDVEPAALRRNTSMHSGMNGTVA
jgi:hypothetical protein